MSFWFRRKGKQGRMHDYSINVSLLVVIAMLGIALALALPFIASCRDRVRSL